MALHAMAITQRRWKKNKGLFITHKNHVMFLSPVESVLIDCLQVI